MKNLALKNSLESLKRDGVITSYNLPPFTDPYNENYDFGLEVPHFRGDRNSVSHFCYGNDVDFLKAVRLVEVASGMFLSEPNL